MLLARRPLLLLTAALVAFPSASAQTARSGRIEGVVFDSLTSKPLPGAAVTVVQLASESRRLVAATTDAAGRYVVDSLEPGRYAVSFSTPFLDSLELQFPGREVTVLDGARVQADFATPSRERLVAAACPGLPLAKGRGAIVGQVSNADTDAPLGRASLVLSWNELALDVKQLRAETQHHDAVVPVDPAGQYRACNVPTDTYVVMQVQFEGRAGTPVQASVPETGGVMLQNLSLSPATSRAFTAADSAGDARDVVGPPPTGTASLTGVVLTADGHPLAGATVSVIDAPRTALSDAQGRFTLGSLAAGTQLLEARHLGYLVGRQPVELRRDRTVTSDIRLSRIVVLDSVRVLAKRTYIEEFERRAARPRATGSILRAADIERRNVFDTSELFRDGRITGFKVVGNGVDARLESTRGQGSLGSMTCPANVVVDGFQHQDLNLVPPSSIAAMEIYRGAAGTPPLYDSACGLILIWTRR